jgi:hypothetical protein
MNNWCICWFFTHILLGILIFKGLTARRLYKSFGVKGLIDNNLRGITNGQMIQVTARSKAWFCGCSRAGIAGSSPAGDMEVFRL